VYLRHVRGPIIVCMRFDGLNCSHRRFLHGYYNSFVGDGATGGLVGVVQKVVQLVRIVQFALFVKARNAKST
jgi:hypothetical protein